MYDEMFRASVAGLVLAALAVVALAWLGLRDRRSYVGRHQARMDTTRNPSTHQRT